MQIQDGSKKYMRIFVSRTAATPKLARRDYMFYKLLKEVVVQLPHTRETFSPINYSPIQSQGPWKSLHVDVGSTTLDRTDDTGNEKGRSKDGGNGRGKGRGK